MSTTSNTASENVNRLLELIHSVTLEESPADRDHDPLCVYQINFPDRCVECWMIQRVRDQVLADGPSEYLRGRSDATAAINALYDIHDENCTEPRCEGPDREFAVAAAMGSVDDPDQP